MPREDTFSRRHGYSATAKEITIREDAPEGLRFVVLQTARDLDWTPGLLPRPLDNALAQVWGYASNEARHVEEGRQPNREEAEFLVGLAAVTATYLTKKQ